jgi:hypothetical protein
MKPKDSSSGDSSEQPVLSSANSRGKQNKSDSGPSEEVRSQRTAVRKTKSEPPAVAGGPKTRKKTAGKMPALPAIPAGQLTNPPTGVSAAANTADTHHSSLITHHSDPALGPHGFPLLSLSKLAEHCDIYRSTARSRLQAAKIKPVVNQEKKKLYELTPDVEALLAESGNVRFDEVKLEDAEISKEIKRAKLEKIRGQTFNAEEILERLIPIFKGLHDRFMFTYAPAAGAELRKLKTGKQITAALKRDFTKIFSELREDYRTFLK